MPLKVTPPVGSRKPPKSTSEPKVVADGVDGQACGVASGVVVPRCLSRARSCLRRSVRCRWVSAEVDEVEEGFWRWSTSL